MFVFYCNRCLGSALIVNIMIVHDEKEHGDQKLISTGKITEKCFFPSLHGLFFF